MTEQRRGKWMFTYTGAKVWPLDLRSEDIDVETIAYSLSKQCRYAGHVTRFYSVAEHCIWLSLYALTRRSGGLDNLPADNVRSAVKYVVDAMIVADELGMTLPVDVIILALWLLFHDAPETWLQDRIRPLKDDDRDYRAHETRATLVVAQRFALPMPPPEEVHILDSRIVVDEVAALVSPGPEIGVSSTIHLADWSLGESLGIPEGIMGRSPPDDVAKAFLALYRVLDRLRRAAVVAP